MKKIALFDFCETIANFQTADAFVDFVRFNENKKSIKQWKRLHSILKRTKIVKILSLLFPQHSINKRIYAMQLRGLSYDRLNELAKDYYKQVICQNLIPDVLNELIKLRNEGYRILLVSGGYDLYLNYFAEDYSINSKDVISTKFYFKGGICTGMFDGKDCMGKEKVIRLNQHIIKDRYYSIAFSDSKSDIPMLDWADEGIVIRKSSNNKWNKKYKEIIWKY